MIDATPDFPKQYHVLTQNGKYTLKGILLTHAHIGHYTGLIHLGREVMGAKSIPVYAMPQMKIFLESNGPWNQLVSLDQIKLKLMENESPQALNDRLTVIPFQVPHRDEYSETVGFRVNGPSRSILYLPDIDKWTRWRTDINEVLQSVDVAYLDGTFFADGELPGRDMSRIPHPFIAESMKRFSGLDASERSKVRFLHLNHTNPALDPESEASRSIKKAGHHVARQGEQVEL